MCSCNEKKKWKVRYTNGTSVTFTSLTQAKIAQRRSKGAKLEKVNA